MINTSHINLVELIGRDTVLKRVANTGGGEWHGACPFCKAGDDRFAVQPNGRGWSCRVCSPHWQDAIEYVKLRYGLDFKAAVEWLGIPLESRPYKKPEGRKINPNAPHPLGDYTALSDSDWQESARLFCEKSFDCLWSKAGQKALSYLKKRGISESVIETAGLGFNPEDSNARWGLTDAWQPRGIVIPWMIDGEFWRVNVRRATGEPKYQQIAGGANGLYNADAIAKDGVAIMVEGEFDNLVIQSHVRGITPVATGTVSWARVLRWVSLLSLNQLVVLAFDVDENGAGDKAVAWWNEQLGDKSIRYAPLRHDITDMWEAGMDLEEWLNPYSLYPHRESTVFELQSRKTIQREFANQGRQLLEII